MKFILRNLYYFTLRNPRVLTRVCIRFFSDKPEGKFYTDVKQYIFRVLVLFVLFQLPMIFARVFCKEGKKMEAVKLE